MRKALWVALAILGSMVAAGLWAWATGGLKALTTLATKADDLIDARMAATLAGLSLAAASFGRDAPRRPAEPEDVYRRRQVAAAVATNMLVRAFYAFTVVLAIGLSWDPASDPRPIQSAVDVLGWAELTVSAAGTAWGIGLLVAGAHAFITPAAELAREG